MILASLAEVTFPNVERVMFVPTAPKFVWLNVLNVSARNCRYMLSPRSFVFLNKDTSQPWSWDERGGIEELRDRMWSALIRVADHIRPGAEEFSRVIQQGESLLAGARTLSGSTLSSLHFMVGDAYATIVWLAQTADSEYHDPKKYQQMAESARAKALERYRAALNLEHGTARSQKARKEAWRLAAGLPPAHGRYFCVYD